MDVNEKIVECWLNNCKEMFTMSDVVYDKYFSAIDLLAVSLKGETGIEVWDIEVKFKSRIIISDTDNKQMVTGTFTSNLFPRTGIDGLER